MTGFLLDTNVPSELVRTAPEPKVTSWVVAQRLDTLFISVISFGELRKGFRLRAPGSADRSLKAGLKTICRCYFPAGRWLSHAQSLSSGERLTRRGKSRESLLPWLNAGHTQRKGFCRAWHSASESLGNRMSQTKRALAPQNTRSGA